MFKNFTLFISVVVISIVTTYAFVLKPDDMMANDLISNDMVSTDSEEKDDVLINLIMRSLERQHFSPNSIDDDASEEIFEQYLNRLDARKRFFTQEDIDDFSAYRSELDDEINKQDFNFFNLSIDALENRTREVQAYYKEILAEPFVFTEKDAVEMDPDKREYCKNSKDLRKRWEQSLKYQVLSRIMNKMDEQKKAIEENNENLEQKSFEDLEIEARGKVLDNHNDWFDRIEKTNDKDRMATYVNSIVQTFDNHTGYFPPKDKEDFDIRLSGKLEGIGATLREEDGFIEVVKIVPGSPCYIQGDLEVEDLITKVAQGPDEPVDVTNMRLGDAVQLIRGKKGTEVRLTVKKSDGTVKIIPIIRDVVMLEETYAKSVILKEKGENVGYIKLPKFYADFDDKNGRQCATDVAREIEKLKGQGIDGLILDLRDNGGGSLRDVVDMAGLFIDEGPVVQIKKRNEPPYIMEDKNSGIEYNGPFIIMVNSFSASASEILAAAMQDYDRAIIVGSETTYGKGTVQRFYDLDGYINSEEFEYLKPLGAIKVTTQKFFRVDGRSTQLKGVEPDIILPDMYTYIETGEKENEFAMPWTEINSVDFDKWERAWAKERLSILSKKRVSQNTVFSKINEDALRRKRNRDQTEYNLHFDTAYSQNCERNEEAQKYKDLQGETLDFEVTSLLQDASAIEEDSIKQQIASDWHERLEKDVYLEETMNIVLDMIGMEN